ncbi:MAG: hypothetical protein ABIP45_10715 [Knoellia sp.]
MTRSRGSVLALLVSGGASIVLGGLVAAVTSPLDLTHGSWAAAYLVLVGGVAQWVMGQARSWAVGTPSEKWWGWRQFGLWNLGNVAVIAGTLIGAPWLVGLGSLLLVGALAIAMLAEWRPRASDTGERTGSPGLHWAYTAMVLILAVSIPIGMTLSVLRHS